MTEEEYDKIMKEVKEINAVGNYSYPGANTTFPQNPHTLAPQTFGNPTYHSQTIPPPADPFAYFGAIGGLDELCEMLGVTEGGNGPMLQGASGMRYSLVRIIGAQIELMARLNILLVHRRLVPDE